MTIESCERQIEKTKKTFSLKFNSFHQLLTNIKEQKWFPVYTDNSEWSDIEFACKLNLTIVSAFSDSEDGFKHVNFFN